MERARRRRAVSTRVRRRPVRVGYRGARSGARAGSSRRRLSSRTWSRSCRRTAPPHAAHLVTEHPAGKGRFPELLQGDVQPKKIAQALARVLDARTTLVRACDEVETRSARAAGRPVTLLGCSRRGWREPAGARGPLVALGALSLASWRFACTPRGTSGSATARRCTRATRSIRSPRTSTIRAHRGRRARDRSRGATHPEQHASVTAFASPAVPWLLALAARAAGATWRASLVAAIAVAAAPEVAVGLFAMTPDLPLAFAWTAALGLAAAGLRADPPSGRAAAALLFAGMLAGSRARRRFRARSSRVGLVVTYAAGAGARARADPWPWAGLLLGALVASPIAAYEALSGSRSFAIASSIRRRGGLSLRNVGSGLWVGQLVYVSPVLLVAAGLVASRSLRARRDDDAVHAAPLSRRLQSPSPPWSCFVVVEPRGRAPLAGSCPPRAADLRRARGLRWSRVSIVLFRRERVSLIAGVYAWVLVLLLPALPASANPRLDIANELVGWPRQSTPCAGSWTKCARRTPRGSGRRRTVLDGLRPAPRGARQGGPRGGTSRPPQRLRRWLPRDNWRDAESRVRHRQALPGRSRSTFPNRYTVRSWDPPSSAGGGSREPSRRAALAAGSGNDANARAHSAGAGGIAVGRRRG